MVTWSSRETEEVNDLLRGLKWRVYIGSLGTDCRAWAAEVAKQRTEYSQWRSMYLFDPKSKRIGSPAPSPPFAPTQEPQISRLQEESSSNEDKDEDEGFYLVTNKGTNESSEGSHKGTKGSGKKDVEEEEEEEERLSADELACAEHAELQKEINEDVVRTYSDHEFFARQDTRDIMNRVLMVYSRRHTALSYVQGMNEILAPLLYALDRDYAQVHALTAEESSVDLDTLSYKPAADLTPEDVRAVISEVVRIDYLEHDVYWLFTCLMRVIGPWFNSPKHPILAPAHSSKHADSNSRSANTASPTSVLPDEAATTSSCSANTNSISSNSSSASSSNCKEIEVVVKCREIQGLLAAKDPELEQALQALGIQPQLYMLRWVRILFSQVFGLDDLLRVWDAVFACGAPFRLVDHLCVTLLTLIRKSVIGRSYSDAMCALFHYPLALFPPPMITAIALGSMRSGALPYYHEAYLPPPPPGSLKLPDLIVNAAELGDPALSMSPGRTPGVRGVVRRRGTGSSSSSSSNNTSEKGNTRDKSAGPGNGEGKQHSWEGLQSKKETLQNFFGGFLKKAPKQQQQQQQQQPNCDPRRPPTQEQLDEATMEIVSLRYEKLHHTSVCNQVAGKLDKLSLLLEVLREKVADDEEGRSVVQQAECEVEDIRRTLTAQTPQQFAPFLPEVSLPQVTTRSSVYPSPPSPTLAQPLEQQQ